MQANRIQRCSVRPPRQCFLYKGTHLECRRYVHKTRWSHGTRPVAAIAAEQEAGGLCCIPGLHQPADLQRLIATTSAAVRQELPHVGTSPEALQTCELLLREWGPLVRLVQQHHPHVEWREAAGTAQQELQALQQQVAHRAQAAGQQLRLLSVPVCPPHLSPEEPTELQQLAAQLAAAFTAIMSDPRCAPRLPVTQQQLAGTLDNGVLLSTHLTPCQAVGWTHTCSSSASDSSQLWGYCLPPQSLLEAAEGLVLQLADTYGEAVHLALQGLGLTSAPGASPTSSSSNGSSASSGEVPNVAGVLVLTWQTTVAVLALPLHAVPAPLQEAVHCLGVTARLAALAPVVGWHRQVLATLAPPEAAAERERSAAAAAAWLRDLAGACRSTAEGEVARWRKVTGWQPPHHLQGSHMVAIDVPVWQLDSLCSSAALADAAMAAGEAPGGARRPQQQGGGAARTTWLEELLPHLAMEQVLQGVASHLSTQIAMHITVAACSPGSAWCGSTTRCSFVLSVQQCAPETTAKEHSSSARYQLLGTVLVLVDDAYGGLPGTSYVRCPGAQGSAAVVVMLPTNSIDWQATTQQGGKLTVQPQTIRILLHELGHALNFVAAAATPANPLPTSMCLDALEVPSHLVQRAATDPAALKVILSGEGQKPVAMRLCRALAAWTQTYTCSPHHLQQHMAVALADSSLPAGGMWSLLQTGVGDGEQAVLEAMQGALQAVGLGQVQLAATQLQYVWGLLCFPLGCVAYISASVAAAALDAKATADFSSAVSARTITSTTTTRLQALAKAVLKEGTIWSTAGGMDSSRSTSAHDSNIECKFMVVGNLPTLHMDCYQDIALWR